MIQPLVMIEATSDNNEKSPWAAWIHPQPANMEHLILVPIFYIWAVFSIRLYWLILEQCLSVKRVYFLRGPGSLYSPLLYTSCINSTSSSVHTWVPDIKMSVNMGLYRDMQLQHNIQTYLCNKHHIYTIYSDYTFFLS